MKWSVKLVSAKGVTLYLHITSLLFIGWIAVTSLAAGMQWTSVLWTSIFILAVFASVALHEYGHAFVASYFGIEAKTIVLYPIGGIASIEKLPGKPQQEFLISSAGPMVNFILAVFCWLLAPQDELIAPYRDFTNTISASNFLYLLGTINFLIALFNLVPAFPLDGGRILRALFGLKFNYIKATSVVAVISKVIAILFVLYGLGMLNFLLVFIGLFILLFAKEEEAYLQLKSLAQGLLVKDIVMYDYNSLRADMTVGDAANVLETNSAKCFFVMENGLPVGVLQRLDVMKALAARDYDKSILGLMHDDLKPINGDTPVEAVLEKLSADEARVYPVINQERLIGVINFQHLIEYLLLHQTTSKDFQKAKSLVELV
jgi:Zn-dependent protease/predicted transcriptional regulator